MEPNKNTEKTKGIQRIPSGINGLDKISGGGIPFRDLVLLSGECGSGKSIFGMQFLNASRDPGVYVSFEEPVEKIVDTCGIFGWDITALERADKLRVVRYDPFKLEDIIEIVESHIREIKAKRVVLDSISALGIYMNNISEIRRTVMQIESVLRRNNCTSILISEIVPGKRGVSRFGVEEFVTDDVIIMKKYNILGEPKRGITVMKMRGSNHSLDTFSYGISTEGIKIGEKLDFSK